MAAASGIISFYTLCLPPAASSPFPTCNLFLPSRGSTVSFSRSPHWWSSGSSRLLSDYTDTSFNGHLRRTTRSRNTTCCEAVVQISDAPLAEGSKTQEPTIGSKVRVNGPLKVYHVPKIPEFDLAGHEGNIKDILKFWKGKPISANLPYKVQFQLEVEGRKLKFIAHLKEGEFEVIN